MRNLKFFLVLIFSFVAVPVSRAQDPQEEFKKHCSDTYVQSGQCPEGLCQVECLKGTKGADCPRVCTPKKCPQIDAQKCPKEYCAIMTDCSNEKICHYQMYGERPKCGGLAYAGQDVACCKGLVRRCGVEFFDATCDMESKNSIYNLPICVPCGDGVCGNFENRCNCPEDCKNFTLDQKDQDEDLPQNKETSDSKAKKP